MHKLQFFEKAPGAQAVALSENLIINLNTNKIGIKSKSNSRRKKNTK